MCICKVSLQLYLWLNCLARVVTRSPQFSHSVTLLKSVHWLLVQSFIVFKLCSIVYQTISSEEPSYLFSMLSLAPKPRELCSSGFHLLFVPRVKTHMPFQLLFGTHSLNTLSHQIASFLSFTIWKLTFQTRLSLLSFHCIWSFVDESCIIPWLSDWIIVQPLY